MNIYTSENEMLKEELKAANAWIKASEKIIAEQDAKLKLALYRAVKTYHEGEPVYVAQPEQPKYRRGDRLICLETEEYCVIHISGTDRQWVKFPDSHIGVYTNEQVAELFELLPKKQPQQEPVGRFAKFTDGIWREVTDGSAGVPLYTTPPQQEQNFNCKSVQARLATAWGYTKAQPEQEPVAWRTFDGEGGYEYRAYEMNEQYAQEWEQRNPKHKDWVKPLYTSPPPQRKPLTDKEINDIAKNYALTNPTTPLHFARAIEAAHGIKENT